MSRVWDIPVHDSTRVRDVRVAAEAASARARLDPHRTAVAALVATELATNLAEHSGDAWNWAQASSGPCLTLMLADGRGHGPKAATASAAAIDELHRTAHMPPAQILQHMNTALRTTRGAAVAVAQLNTEKAELGFAGVGNVGACVRSANAWQPLISHPGIVGAHFPATVPVQHLPWRRDSLLVLHSDGLPSRWTPPEDTELLDHDPAVVAAAIVRDAGSAARPLRDDTSVAILAPDRWAGTHERHP
ncbi:SpoIIE family protein phosphatase [Streptomyces massasporeus]|uniref:SpoIIE family protein phosphatase n=1 Tax=Streptomyces massasporeus TaxID=67324 RepID=UPI00371126C5